MPNFSQKGWKLPVNELEMCALFVEILVLRNKVYLRAFFGCREIRSQNVWKVITFWLIKWGLLVLRQDNRAHIYKSSRKEVSNALFLVGNTNKALCSAATLAVLDALDAITSWCRRPKLRDLKSAMEEAIRKRNHAFGNESTCIRVRPPFIISSRTVYISWLFRMSAKCVWNLSRTIGPVSTKCQKEYCNSFFTPLVKSLPF